jgi:hypothetical protein
VIKAGESLPPSLVEDGILDIQFMKDCNEKPEIVEKLLIPEIAKPRLASKYSRFVVLAFTGSLWRLNDLYLIRNSTKSLSPDSERPSELLNLTTAVKPLEDSNRVHVRQLSLVNS